ncbi:unnamed protein product [Thelazia callipaeda]|uniref:Secreted protein n=1 Tax=Thelazia callipaeda TaxID=103827 RepID=A0A0N5DCK4_THECL|nr:unnamed protein product [Thelazia callipaeda]
MDDACFYLRVSVRSLCCMHGLISMLWGQELTWNGSVLLCESSQQMRMFQLIFVMLDELKTSLSILIDLSRREEPMR